MSDRLTLGSLFSGSGTFELGGMLAGIQPIWNAEIEPFPIMVTRRRLPQVKHYGDVSALDGARHSQTSDTDFHRLYLSH